MDEQHKIVIVVWATPVGGDELSKHECGVFIYYNALFLGTFNSFKLSMQNHNFSLAKIYK